MVHLCGRSPKWYECLKHVSARVAAPASALLGTKPAVVTQEPLASTHPKANQTASLRCICTLPTASINKSSHGNRCTRGGRVLLAGLAPHVCEESTTGESGLLVYACGQVGVTMLVCYFDVCDMVVSSEMRRNPFICFPNRYDNLGFDHHFWSIVYHIYTMYWI